MSLTPELVVHARRAVALAAVLMDLLDDRTQLLILLMTGTHRASAPGVVGACGDLQHSAELSHTIPSNRRPGMMPGVMPGVMLLDEPIACG